MTWRHACAALLMVVPFPVWADAIVVAATGPVARQLQIGKRLGKQQRIDLGPSDRITVLDERGTRVIHGPTRFVPNLRSTGNKIASSVWLQGGILPRGAVSRGLGDLDSNPKRFAKLTDSAMRLSAKGLYAQSNAVLAEITPKAYSHAVQCRLVENLRFFNRVAGSLDDATGSPLADVCVKFAVPPNMTDLMVKLDINRENLKRLALQATP